MSSQKHIIIVDATFLPLLSSTKNSFVISSETELNTLLSIDFSVTTITILVELNWQPLATLHGYRVAQQLLFHPNRKSHFHLEFLSVLPRDMLLKIAQIQTLDNSATPINAPLFVRKFEHKPFPRDGVIVSPKNALTSKMKFDFLVNYCFHQSGILSRMLHDLGNLDVDSPSKIVNFQFDVHCNKAVLTPSICELAEKLSCRQTKSQFNALINSIEEKLLVLSDNKDTNILSEVHPINVLLVEDDPQVCQLLAKQFAVVFKNVYAFTSGTDALLFMKDQTNHIDALITDLELLIGEFDDPIQGVDLIEYCQMMRARVCIRVITSLPRDAVSRLLKIDIGDLVFKVTSCANSVVPLPQLKEFAIKLVNDVRRTSLIFEQPGPRLSWWGKYLTKTLFKKQKDFPQAYRELWNRVKTNVNKFVSGEFDELSEQKRVSVSFPKTQFIIKQPEVGNGYIELLLTHRLIALWYAEIHCGGNFSFTNQYDSLLNQSYTTLPGFQTGLEKRDHKSYFNTLLGLSVAVVKEGRSQNKSGTTLRILLKDLFSEETGWLAQTKASVMRNLMPNLHLMLLEVHDLLAGKGYKNIPFLHDDASVNAGKEFLAWLIDEFAELESFHEDIYELYEADRHPLADKTEYAWESEIQNHAIREYLLEIDRLFARTTNL